MKLLTKTIAFFLNSNLFIGVCAVAMVCTGNLFLKGTLVAVNPAVLLLVGSATFLTYNLTVFLLELRLSGGEGNFRRQWFRERSRPMYLLLVLALLVCMASLFYLPWEVLLFLFHLGVVSILYNVPDRYAGPRYRSIRSIPLIKVFLIAYVWAALSVGMPFLQSHMGWEVGIELFSLQFFFIIAITLPFDIRDIDNDRQRLLTIPAWLGIGVTKLLATLLMLLYVLLAGLWFSSTVVPAGLLAIPTLLLIWKASPARPYWYYTGLIDGLILLQFILLLLLL